MYKNRNPTNAIRILVAYLDDYKKGLHVREMAKATKLSPSTVSYLTRNLEKECVLDHVMEGLNKKYFVNYGNPAVKGMLAAAELSKKTAILEKYFVIKKMAGEVDFGNAIVALFGSFAGSTAADTSDIDILLLDRTPEIKKKLEKFGKLYGKQLHVISMTKKDFLSEKKEFIKEIMKNHVVLNGAEEFVDMIWRIYHGA
jgi:DNA-binding Lrp family transcriptional regulator